MEYSPRTGSTSLVLQIVKAVLYSFIGIRKRIDMEADFNRLPLLPLIVAGIIAATLFVGAVMLAVRFAVA